MRTTARYGDSGLASPGLRRCWLAWALLLALPLAAAACTGSSRSTGDNGATQADAGDEEDYPNLSRVPGEAPRPTPESLRKELIEGLKADHAHARYTGELLTAASAAVPPAAPPPAAKSQVEVIWQTERVLPEGESETVEEATVSEEVTDSGDSAVSGDAAAVEGTGAAPEAAGEPEAATETVEEEIEINWDTERVEPSGKVAVAGQSQSEEELLLAPQPELLAVVYFPQDSTQVDGNDRQLLEDVVARFKERGGRLRLVGHSGGQAQTDDVVGQRMANLELSLERANAVASTLLDLGADKEELLVEAKADNETTGDDVQVGGESSTRKVEIFLEH
jgi:outer membrane protein OmpA-like peptidoglycan-associated protein